MFFKNPIKQDGFMLIEVVLAVALLGIGSIAIMNLQTNTLGRVHAAQVHLDHLFKLQNLFFDPEMQKNRLSADTQMQVFEFKDIQDFKTLKYETMPAAKNSELNRFADVYLMQAAGSWAGFNHDYDDSLIGLVYLAPKKPELQEDQEEKQKQSSETKSPSTKSSSAKSPEVKKSENNSKQVKAA